MPKLSSVQVEQESRSVPKWTHSGDAIKKQCKFADFKGSMEFVNSVAALANAADHHPDIDIRFDKVTLVLSTHSEGGLTEKDFGLAREIDGIG